MDLGAATGMDSVSEPARVAAADEAISADELQFAARNNGLPGGCADNVVRHVTVVVPG